MTELRRYVACTVWSAMAFLALPHTAAAQEPYPGLDAYIVKSMQTLKVPGMAVAIVRNDSVIYTKGFGVLAVGSHAPVDDRTLFEIGSSTKAFTATLMSMMVSDGKMHYDDLISKYLPDFKLYDPYASAQVTLRDALLHRTGVGRGEWTWIDAGTSREDVLHRVRFLPPTSPFRSKWSYQNIMYLAVGQAVGKAAGTTWDDLLQQRIFTPLGMTSSHATYLGVTTTNLAIAHAMDHDTVFRKERFNAENIAPAGGIVTNARDMAQWLRLQLSGGVINGKRLVDSAAFLETHTPQILMGPGSPAGGDQPRFSTYGMGWMIQDYRHQVMVQHGGNTPGMTAAVGMLPEKKIGVAVLSNLDHSQLPDMLMHYIFDRQLGEPMHDYVAEAYKRSQSRRRPADTTAAHVPVAPPLPLSAYVGTYSDSVYGAVTVAIQNGNLVLTRGLAHGRLEYWNANNFRWWSNGSISGALEYITFDISPDNKVLGVYYGMAPDVELLPRERKTAGPAAKDN
jgi:CubicO group peptidase (beta-lactamase class C family)